MKTAIQTTAAYQLIVNLERTPYGTVFKLISLVPTARHPEEQVKFQTTLSDAELKTFAQVLSNAVAHATI